MTQISIIGSGSWATALVKILSDNQHDISWWIRRKEHLSHIQTHSHHPSYLSDVLLPLQKIKLYSRVEEAIQNSSIVFLVTPAAFIQDALKNLPKDVFKNKLLVSAIKGIIPQTHTLVTTYLQHTFQILEETIGIIGGPCHAEEVAMEKQSYLTIASTHKQSALTIATLLENRYIKTLVSNDPLGIEYSAVLKNIIAIASGMAHGLFYGDNFQAVLVAAGIREIEQFLDHVAPQDRCITDSAYLGDLMVTAYSQFSRNRTLGMMIGKGYSIQSAQLEMNMIAEGYYATKCIYDRIQDHKLTMPIIQTVYRILYEKSPVAQELRQLSEAMA